MAADQSVEADPSFSCQRSANAVSSAKAEHGHEDGTATNGTATDGTATTDYDVSSDEGMRIFSYLLAGMIVYGGLGWLLDRVFDTKWIMLVGILLGTVLSLYSVIRKFGSAR